MKRGRPSMAFRRGTFKTNEEFREYMLDKLVDKDGNKVSVRTLIKQPFFMNETGYYGFDKNGRMKPISLGTISYWLEQLNVTEKYLYEHHTTVTDRIKCSFEEFTKKDFKNNNRSKKLIVDFYKEPKRVLVNTFNRLAKLTNYNDVIFDFYQLTDIVSAYESLILLRYGDNIHLFSKDYYKVR